MKILCMTVGTGRNRSDIASALLYSINHHKPEKVVFFCSKKTVEQTMPQVRKGLLGITETAESVCEDENKAHQLFIDYLEQLRDLRNDSSELIIDFTSGTKAMTASIFAAGVAVEADLTSYVVGERDEGGRVMVSTGIESLEPKEVVSYTELMKAQKLFNENNYDAAWKIGEKVVNVFPKGSYYRSLAGFIRYVGQAYSQWERFEWGRSAKTLIEGCKHKSKIMQVLNSSDLLEEQAMLCQKLEGDFYGLPRLVDLYLNAQRRIEQGKFDDAVARLYRGFEYSIQIKLKEAYNIDTSNVKINLLADKGLCDQTVSLLQKRRLDDGKIKIGLRDSMLLLAELGDEFGLWVGKQYYEKDWLPLKNYSGKIPCGKLQDYLSKRNKSYLAHGTVRIERAVAKRMLSLYKEALVEMLGDQELEKYLASSKFIILS